MPRYFRGNSLLLNSILGDSKMQNKRFLVSYTTAGLAFCNGITRVFCCLSSVKVPQKDLFSGEKVVERELFCCSQKIFISIPRRLNSSHTKAFYLQYNFGAPLEEREENFQTIPIHQEEVLIIIKKKRMKRFLRNLWVF